MSEALRTVLDLWQGARERAVAPPALLAVAASLPDPAAIPPREWLYGTRLVRRYVSVMVAPGGVGKSALALAQAVALATGRAFLGERVHHSVPAWVLNLEDPLDELHRRLAALMRRHGIDRSAIEGRLYLHSGRTRRVSMAEASGEGVVHPDRDAIVAASLAAGIGLIVVDPFVKSHRLDENSNADMDAAATAWAEVAERAGAAVLLVHHVRKGGDAKRGADVESARGAKSLTDAARSASVLAPMSEAEAEELGVAPAERWRHVRLDDAKANLAPPAGSARALWYRLESVSLGNGTADYPSGDHVAAIASWSPPLHTPPLHAPPLHAPASDPPPSDVPPPPSGFAPAQASGVLDGAAVAQALAEIAAGPGGGLAFSAHRGRPGERDRWAGRILVDRFGLDPAAAARQLARWLAAGVLVEARYHDPVQRKPRLGVRVGRTLPQPVPERTAP